MPKTAGTSIKEGLQQSIPCYSNRYREHETAQSLSTIFKEYQDYFKFAFARNPFDRTVSWYFWLKQQKASVLDVVLAAKELDFKQWVYEVFVQKITNKDIGRHPFVVWIPYVSQSYKDFYVSDIGQIDFIGRYENLVIDWGRICSKLGVPYIKLPIIHKTEHDHYSTYYNTVTKQIVSDAMSWELEYFDYRFIDAK